MGEMILNSTQTPDVILDHWLPYLSGGQFKVLMYIVRQTYGWQKNCDCISMSQFVNGKRTKKGAVIDEGVGLRESQVRDILNELAEKGLVTKCPHQDQNGSPAPCEFSLNLEWRATPEDEARLHRTIPATRLNPALAGEVRSSGGGAPERSGEVRSSGGHQAQGEVRSSAPTTDSRLQTGLQTVERDSSSSNHRAIAKTSQRPAGDDKAAPSLSEGAQILMAPISEGGAAFKGRADAERLALQSTPEGIRAWIVYARERDIQNISGYIRTAIQNGGEPPSKPAQSAARQASRDPDGYTRVNQFDDGAKLRAELRAIERNNGWNRLGSPTPGGA